MPSWSLAEIGNDSDMGEPVTIVRSSGSFAAGGWSNTTSTINSWGVVAVAEDEALRQIPEADRVEGALMLVSALPVYETLESRSGLSDQIIWNGNNYRVVRLGPWSDFGYYHVILMRMTGS